MSVRPYYGRPSLFQVFSPFYAVEPFYSGKSVVPENQTSLYYTPSGFEGDVHRRIDFSKAGADDLAALYEACKLASFGRNGETVLDEEYRKAKAMDLDSFATQFDPRKLGILDRVTRGLLAGTRSSCITEMELYKLNVYGKGDFFKFHKDTPRSENMVGSLVVVLPTRHEGGQLVLRQCDKTWNIDFTDAFATATESLVCFVVFFGDVEHEVLPVTSGHRVTLTYNLYREPSQLSTTYIPTPYHQQLKQALINLVNDKSTLPEGGYLGFGLLHEYVYNGNRPVDALLDQLKGADDILAIICEDLDLQYSLKLLYRNIDRENISLISRSKLTLRNNDTKEGGDEFLADALSHSTIAQVEGVEIVGRPFDRSMIENEDSGYQFLEQFYRNPVTKVLEIRSMSSVGTAKAWISYGNEAHLRYTYGHVCLLISIDPVASRKELVL